MDLGFIYCNELMMHYKHIHSDTWLFISYIRIKQDILILYKPSNRFVISTNLWIICAHHDKDRRNVRLTGLCVYYEWNEAQLLTASYWKTHECAENLHLLDQALAEALRCMNWAIKHQNSNWCAFTQKESEHVNISKSQKWFVKRNVSFGETHETSRDHTSPQKQLRNKLLKCAWRKWSLFTHHSCMCCSFFHFYFHQRDFVLQ